MTLTNPTDDQLNRNFAIYVAECGPEHPAYDGHDYCGSFDAVLPWLEKSPFDFRITYCQTTNLWTVRLLGRFTSNKEFVGESDDRAALAAVLALLRSHGVEIVFA